MDENLTNFGETHFGSAQLGDKRSTERLVLVADALLAHPDGSLPEKFHDKAQLEGAYHLVNRDKTTHEAVTAPHFQRTRQAIADHDGTILVAHDDSDIDLSSRQSLKDELGSISGKHNRGLVCHSSLAATVTGKPLGIANQIFHVNKKRKSKNPDRKSLRECPRRQTRLWVKGREAIGDFPGKLVVDLVDRGGDTFEFLDFEHAHDYHYVARAKTNRQALRGHEDGDEKKRKIHVQKHMRTLPEQGRRPLTVPYQPAKPGKKAQPARQTEVAVSWLEITLPAPKPSRARGEHRQESLRLWVVRVWEVSPPAGVEAAEWFLNTNVPVNNAQEAWERVDWYEWRWPMMEEFHKGIKTGCKIEGPQFRTLAALIPLLGILSVVGWMLMYLRHVARDPETASQPAVHHVPELWVKWLSLWREKVVRLDWTVREFFYALAYLGGHLNRPCDGHPGWQTLWKGWIKLRTALEFTAAQPP